MIALSIAIIISSLFISMAAIYAVYMWAEVHTKQIESYEEDRRAAREALKEMDDDNDNR